MDDVNLRKVRSAVSNGTRLLIDFDGRSPWGRRLRDLLDDLASDLGGIDALSEAERLLIRRTAMLSLQAEMMEQRFAKNGGCASVQELECYQRATNTLRRTLESLYHQPAAFGRRPIDVSPDDISPDEARSYLAEIGERP
jgi:hypothetical protein